MAEARARARPCQKACHAVWMRIRKPQQFQGIAGVVQWQNGSFPSCIRGFDSLRPLQSSRTFGRPVAAAYLSPSIARTVQASKDDGAETWSGLRADPGAVPGASTLAA